MATNAQSRVKFDVQLGDITTTDVDLVALKNAQAFFGADRAVAELLGVEKRDFSSLGLGDFKIYSGNSKVGARHVLFIRVTELYNFGYEEIRNFSSEVLRIAAQELPNVKRLAMTVHGVGYGLDEGEAFRSQLAGYLDAFDNAQYPTFLEQIVIIEKYGDRVERLRSVLKQAIPNSYVLLPEKSRPAKIGVARSPSTSTVGRESADKPHVFIAMPFAKEMNDTFHYGIQSPVNTAGYLCERIDATAFIGDVLGRIKSRIETASFVIAELTSANPNVTLEVGYAWGKNRPTILLTKEPEKLPFDLRGQRCLVYSQITDLEEALSKEIRALEAELHG